MENIVSSPIHIEFYGLPGCGKSTISHNIVSELTTRGYIVTEPSYTIDHSSSKFLRRIKKIFSTVCYSIFNREEVSEVLKIIEKSGYITNISKFRQLVNIVPKLRVYKKNERGITVWDEGLIQSTISLLMNNTCNMEDFYKYLLLPSSSKVIKVYLKVDVDTAKKRMKNRVLHDSRIERESDEYRKNKLLGRLYTICETIPYSICIDNKEEKETTNLLLNQIIELIKSES